MTTVVEAIYSHGVLRPVESLGLSEQQRVELTVRVMSGEREPPDWAHPCSWPEMETSSEARQAALDALFEEIDRANLQLKLRLPTRDELHERR